jgi:F-box protein 9
MDSKDVPTNTEAELESFRQKWREEVTAKTKGNGSAASTAKSAATSSNKSQAPWSNAPDASSSSHARQRSVEDVDDIIPYTYQDLGEKQHGRRLDETSVQTATALAASQDPSSALEHYERAVEKESAGRLGDSVNLYRKAFKVGNPYWKKSCLSVGLTRTA